MAMEEDDPWMFLSQSWDFSLEADRTLAQTMVDESSLRPGFRKGMDFGFDLSSGMSNLSFETTLPVPSAANVNSQSRINGQRQGDLPNGTLQAL